MKREPIGGNGELIVEEHQVNNAPYRPMQEPFKSDLENDLDAVRAIAQIIERLSSNRRGRVLAAVADLFGVGK